MAVVVKPPSFLTRVREMITRPTTVRELIGRYAVGVANFFNSRPLLKTTDETVPDYAWWDRLRRGKLRGYTLGALFSDRIERVIAAWVLGDGVEIALREDSGEDAAEEAEDDEGQAIDQRRIDYTNAELANFVASLLDAGQSDEAEGNEDLDDVTNSLLLTIFRDSMGLGDQYIFVNMDGTLSIPSPETVTVVRDARDYRRILKVIVTTRTDEEVITDEYRADGRTITVTRGNEVVDTQNYANLIGRINMIHVAFGRSRNETNGHSIHEALRPLYDMYDDVIYKMIDGARLLGNPIPTFEGMESISEVLNANSPAAVEDYLANDGTVTKRPQVKLDRNSVVFVGKGGRFHFASAPVGFTADTQQVLKTLFLLLLDRTGIPEFIWGNELSSARASSDTQMVQFVKDIMGWRRDSGGWIVKLCRIWLQVRALTDPMIVVGALRASWPPLLDEDQALRLKKIQVGRKERVLTRTTTLKLLALVKNPEQEAAEAMAEAEAEDLARQAAAAVDGAPNDPASDDGQDNPDEEKEP